MFEHLRILSSVLNLILGTCIAYYAYSKARLYSYAFLKPLFYHIIAFNLCILVLGTSKYLDVNLPREIFHGGHPSLVDIMISAAILFWFVMLYALYRLSEGFKGSDIPVIRRSALKAAIAAVTVASLAGAFLPQDGISQKVMDGIRVSFAISGVILDIAIAVRLWKGSGRIADRGIARISRRFAVLYLSRYGLMTLLLSIVPAIIRSEYASAATAFVVLLYFNLVPLIWIKVHFNRFIDDIVMVIEDKALLGMFFDRHGISSREQEIVKLILDGMSNREIGDSLHISFHTVKNHVYNIYQKLGIKNRYQLVNLIGKTMEE